MDRYPVPLTGGHQAAAGGPRLQATALVGPGGRVLRLELTAGREEEDKESTVHRLLLPGACMLFLCKQELSTPAMMDRLLVRS